MVDFSLETLIFNIASDLELTSIYSNSDLRRIWLSTTNRSILVIEDIDCSVEMNDRQDQDQYELHHSKVSKVFLVLIFFFFFFE